MKKAFVGNFSLEFLFACILVMLFVACVSCQSGNDADDNAIDGTFATEPPVNPYLADSVWPMSHRNPYCQASSPFPGPVSTGDLKVAYLAGPPVSISLLFSPHPQREVVWASNVSRVEKIDASSQPLSTIAKLSKGFSGLNPIAGAYTMLYLGESFSITACMRPRRLGRVITSSPERYWERWIFVQNEKEACNQSTPVPPGCFAACFSFRQLRP